MPGRGVQLLEREHEMRILYEKVNEQERVGRERTIESQALEEENHSLRMLITEESRQIDLCKKQMSSKSALEQESTLLQIQVLKISSFFQLKI